MKKLKNTMTLTLIFVIVFCFSSCSNDFGKDLKKDINNADTPKCKVTSSSVSSMKPKELQFEKDMRKVHVDPDFPAQYEAASRKMNLKDPNVAKKMVQEGYRITINGSKMTEKEINLWTKIANNKSFTMYTVEDAQEKMDEMNKILEEEAQNNNETVRAFISSYGLTEDECEIFLERQAKKYVAKKEPVTKEVKSKKTIHKGTTVGKTSCVNGKSSSKNKTIKRNNVTGEISEETNNSKH